MCRSRSGIVSGTAATITAVLKLFRIDGTDKTCASLSCVFITDPYLPLCVPYHGSTLVRPPFVYNGVESTFWSHPEVLGARFRRTGGGSNKYLPRYVLCSNRSVMRNTRRLVFSRVLGDEIIVSGQGNHFLNPLDKNGNTKCGFTPTTTQLVMKHN